MRVNREALARCLRVASFGVISLLHMSERPKTPRSSRAGSSADDARRPRSASRPATDKTVGQRPAAVNLRIGLYFLAVLTAAGTLFVAPALKAAVGRGALAMWWLKIPLLIYGLFAVVFVADRIWQVRRRRYPAGKALYQIAFVVIFSLTLPTALLRAPPEAKNVITNNKRFNNNSLHDPRPEIRRDFAYAMGYQGYSFKRVQILIELLDDSDLVVRDAALRVLSEWSGQPNGQISGIRAWASALSNTSTVSGREKNE